MRAAGLGLVAALLPLTGCALLDKLFAPPPEEPVELRFHLAWTDPLEGVPAAQDEAGRPLYIAEAHFLTERDVAVASAFRSERRSLVLLELTPAGEIALESATMEHVGQRLAIYVDGRLVMSPVVRAPLRQGKVYLDGDFSAAEAGRLAERINATRARRPAPGASTGPR